MNVNERQKLLIKHLELMKVWLKEEGINPDSNLGRELLKQTRELIQQHYDIQLLRENLNRNRRCRTMRNEKDINKLVLPVKVEIKGLDQGLEKVEKYIELLKEAKTLANELASVVFDLEINHN